MKKIITIAVLALVFAGIAQTTQVNAGTTEFTGWAWSPNIGWLSFNSTNAGAGSGAAYSVKVSTSTGSDVGTISGQAWSPNVGWLSFDTAGAAAIGSDCPSGTCGATMNMISGLVSGWGQILSMKLEETGGWLRLSGTNHASPDFSGFNGTSTRGVTYNKDTGALTGFAYEPSAIGWISFGAANAPGCVGTGCGVCVGTCVTVSSTVTATCTSNPANPVSAGTTVTFTGSGTGGTSPYTYSWDSGPYVTGNTNAIPYQGTGVGPILKVKDAAGVMSSSLSCPGVVVNGGGGGGPVQLLIGPTGAQANSSSYTTEKGKSFGLKWTNTLLDQGYSCTESNTGSWSNDWGGDAAGNASYNVGNVQTGTYTFTISCRLGLAAPINAAATLKVRQSSVQEI